MIDINYIIENKEHVKELLKRKLYDADIDSLVEDVEAKRKLLKAVEDNKAKQNKKTVDPKEKARQEAQMKFKKNVTKVVNKVKKIFKKKK